MSTRAEALAKEFEQVNEEMIRAVEGCGSDHWRSTTASEGWSVGVTAHHVATSVGPVAQLAHTIATGGALPPITPDMINAGNAQHAKEHANCTKEETVALLRDAGAKAAAMVRGLTDEQLDRTGTFFGQSMSAESVIRNILIGHTRSHLPSVATAA